MNRKKKLEQMKKVLISIKGLPFFAEGDDYAYELTTDGEYLQKGEVTTFRYLESTLTGQSGGGYLTTFDVEQDRITLRRSDNTTGDMIFSENQKHHFLYDTPYGAVMMGIDTHSITKDLSGDGGNIEIRYDIEVDNMPVSRNLFKIEVKSLAQ